MTLHLDDAGCLCERCKLSDTGCAIKAYVVLAQKRAKKSAPRALGESTLQMRLSQCNGFVAKAPMCPSYRATSSWGSSSCGAFGGVTHCGGDFSRCLSKMVKSAFEAGCTVGEQDFIDAPDPAVLSDMCEGRR